MKIISEEKITESSDSIEYIGQLVQEEMAKAILHNRNLELTAKEIALSIKKWVTTEDLWKNNQRLPNEAREKELFLLHFGKHF